MTQRSFRLSMLLVIMMTAAGAAAAPVARLVRADVTTLSTPLSGRIDTIRVKVGDRVKKGQLLATLDARPWRAELKRARAALQGLKSRAEEARRALDRARELFDRTVLSQTDLQQARIDHDIAQGAWLRARAELEKAEIDLDYTKIVAPFNGVITAVDIRPGEVIVNRCQATPVIHLARDDRWLARFRFAQPAGFRTGDRVKLRAGETPLAGRVDAIRSSETGAEVVDVVIDKEGRDLLGKLVEIDR